MIGILDMDMGNLRSVANAVYQQGFDPVVVSNPAELSDVTHLIIPGVGQFATAMRHVDKRGLTQAVREFAASARPVLGVCLGMQLLATRGYEGGLNMGFNLIPGEARRLLPAAGIRVPHVGWNRALLKRQHPVLQGLKPERDFYFVHSYAFHCHSPQDVLAETDYGQNFASMVAHRNVIGFQFHPEKSQVNGLRLLENFCRWDGAC